jgi:hypothetical protein
VALVRIDVSEELSPSITRVTRIGKLETLAVTVALVRTDVLEELSPSETSVLTRATWHNIPEYIILRKKGLLQKVEPVAISEDTQRSDESRRTQDRRLKWFQPLSRKLRRSVPRL